MYCFKAFVYSSFTLPVPYFCGLLVLNLIGKEKKNYNSNSQMHP